jgi:GNAT superfamily N-acetyltransferase
MNTAEPALAFRWATPSRWKDVEALFGEKGACAGCWCMVWRLERARYEAGKGAGNRRALRRLVEGGARPGVIAYAGREPVAWCAVAPRGDYGYLARSRVLAPVDDTPVWSITCLFVAKEYRRRGVSARLLRATAEMALARGARAVEGYPQSLSMAKIPDSFVWTGLPSAFEQAGFVEVARRSPARPIMRFPG